MGALYARAYSQFSNVKSVKGHKERMFRTIYLFPGIGSFFSVYIKKILEAPKKVKF